MLKSRRQLGLFIAVAGAGVLGACTTPARSVEGTLEQHIENATSAQDHEALAQEYERQAQLDASTATRHVAYAAAYRRNKSARSSPQAHEPMARHCEELARTYQKTAAEKMEMARLHRDLARQAR